MTTARILLSAALAAFAVAVVGNGLDRATRETPAIERLVPEPFRAQADRSAAEVALSRQEYDSAGKDARAAVSHDPVDPDSTALLGSARTFKNDAAGADAAYRIAARFGWRNVSTQIYWLQAALQSGDYEVAADRTDAILRSHPGYPQLSELLAPLESDARGRAALAAHVRQSPPWLANYLEVPASAPAALLEQRMNVLSLATAGNVRLSCESLGTPVLRLIHIGHYADARSLWNRNCPQAVAASGVLDADFAHLARNDASPFGWQSYLAGDVSISFEGQGHDQLLVLTNAAPIGHVVLQQPADFSPGTYRVVIDGNAAAVNAAALSWKCDNGAGEQLAAGNLARNGSMLKVTECSRQLLGLWLPGHASAMKFRQVQLLPVGSAGAEG